MTVTTSRTDRARQSLRAGTAEAHETLDARFGGFDLAHRDDYARFLLAHAAALPPVERALDEVGMADLLDDWPMRRRAGLIADDLAAMGVALPPPLPAPSLTDPAAAWGAAYVVEGSRLGGAMLARRVDDGLPRAYLATPLPAGAWRKFLASMEVALYSESMRASATGSALDIFALFARAADEAIAR
jgi:heme oxygenase